MQVVASILVLGMRGNDQLGEGPSSLRDGRGQCDRPDLNGRSDPEAERGQRGRRVNMRCMAQLPGQTPTLNAGRWRRLTQDVERLSFMVESVGLN
jgi:hypothetical protein